MRELQLRLGELTIEEPAQRRHGRRSQLINAALGRYFELLRRARKGLKRKFSPQEICLILDATNGTLWEPFEAFLMLPHTVGDAIKLDRLDKKWKVDARIVLSKLEQCSPLELAALVDATERFWNRTDPKGNPEEALDF